MPLEVTKKSVYDTLTNLAEVLEVEEFIVRRMHQNQISSILTALHNHGVGCNPDYYCKDKKWIATVRKRKEDTVLLACRLIRCLTTPSGEQLSEYVLKIENDAMERLLESNDDAKKSTTFASRKRPLFDQKFVASLEKKLEQSAQKRARKPSPR
mmetsp:Transcript_16270/g.18856  ORF Transcript_16270/g.18856 Transcript_16270/m.18856 type:complete len:154 (-) Transcript_16270:96-557(-)